MNLCFFIGEIVSDIKFEFIINSINNSIAIFELKLKNNSILQIKAYNEKADECFRKLKKGQNIFIYGTLKKDFVLLEKVLVY